MNPSRLPIDPLADVLRHQIPVLWRGQIQRPQPVDYLLRIVPEHHRQGGVDIPKTVILDQVHPHQRLFGQRAEERLAPLQFPLRRLPVADVLQCSLVPDYPSLLIPYRPAVVPYPDRRAVRPPQLHLVAPHLPFQIHPRQLPLPVPVLHVHLPDVEPPHGLLARVAQQLGQCRVGLHDLAVRCGAVQPDGHPLEKTPVASLGLP